MPRDIHKDAAALLAKIPPIPARSRDLLESFARLTTLLDCTTRTKLRTILKFIAYTVLFLNAGSLPFVWHIRVFWPLISIRLQYLLFHFRLIWIPKREWTHVLIAWAEGLSPVGANPFEFTAVYKRWASIDDIDMFGFHLSNSSYAKALDSARTKALVKWFPTWGRSGGHLALGATHYNFLREIAPLARYEVRLTIASWDHKWLYVVARYVTLPGRCRATQRSPQSSQTSSTPNDSPAPLENGPVDVEQAIAAIIHADNTDSGSTRRAPFVELDGGILHCIAISQICFKWGRLTVPPAVVLGSEGFTGPSGDNDMSASVPAYSRANPPPNWIESQSLRVPPHGSMNNFRAFLRGKWREAPEGRRWWEDALGGSIEERRRANLQILDSLRLGLEGVRALR